MKNYLNETKLQILKAAKENDGVIDVVIIGSILDAYIKAKKDLIKRIRGLDPLLLNRNIYIRCDDVFPLFYFKNKSVDKPSTIAATDKLNMYMPDKEIVFIIDDTKTSSEDNYNISAMGHVHIPVVFDVNLYKNMGFNFTYDGATGTLLLISTISNIENQLGRIVKGNMVSTDVVNLVRDRLQAFCAILSEKNAKLIADYINTIRKNNSIELADLSEEEAIYLPYKNVLFQDETNEESTFGICYDSESIISIMYPFYQGFTYLPVLKEHLDIISSNLNCTIKLSEDNLIISKQRQKQ